MTIDQATAILKSHDYTPGVSSTAGIKGDKRAEIKEACAVLHRAGKVLPKPKAPKAKAAPKGKARTVADM